MKGLVCRATVVLVALALPSVAGAHAPPFSGVHQHGDTAGHLIGAGAFGDIKLLSTERVTTTPEIVADVAVSPDGNWAYLANWGEPDCVGPETGGQTSPDAGAWVVDIRDLEDPQLLTFIPSTQDPS